MSKKGAILKSVIKISLITFITILTLNAKAVSPNSYNRVINQKGLVVVELWAPWCGNCLAFKPVYNSIKRKYSSKIRFYEINTDPVDDPFSTFGIKYGLPVIQIFKNGALLDSKEGGMSKDEMEAWINYYK